MKQVIKNPINKEKHYLNFIDFNFAQVAKELQIYPVPSAFQIRFGGCKGVVAQDPALGNDADVLVIRESMKKFESGSNNLEILEVTLPGKLTYFGIA